MRKTLIFSLLLIMLLSFTTLVAAETDSLEGYLGFDVNTNSGIGLIAGGRNWLGKWKNVKVGAGSEVEFISYQQSNKTYQTLGWINKINFDITEPINRTFDYPALIVDNDWTIKSFTGLGLYFVGRGDSSSLDPGLKLGTSISFPISEVLDFRSGLGFRTLDDFGGLFINFSLMQNF